MADDYQLSYPWSDVDTAAAYLNQPVVFTEESDVITASISGAEIYVLLSDITHNYNVYAIDAEGRQPCAMTVKPTSIYADVKFSIVDGTTLYIYTLAGGGSTVTVETVDVSASSGSLFWITLSLVNSTWEMDCSYSDIAAAQLANKVILAKSGTNVFYNVGDPTDDGLTVSRTCFDANGAWIDGFIIDSTDDSVTRISPITVTADNVVKYTAQNLSAAQQAQACENIGAAKKLLVRFAEVHGSIVADVSYAEIDAAVAANQVIEAVYGYFCGPMVYMNSDKVVFVTTGLPNDPTIYTLSITSSDVVSGTANVPLFAGNQATKTPSMTTPIGVDLSGKLWVALADGLTNEVKTALLNCFAHVAWSGTDGDEYYNDLFDVLYPTARPISITAVYTQSGTVYTTTSLNALKDDLVVTVHYSDDTSQTTQNYTLSGTLTAGTSAVTVTYSNLTTTFNVTVTASPVPSGYTPVEYIERPIGSGTTGGAGGMVTTGFKLNGTDTAVIKMGVECLEIPAQSGGGYFLSCRQTSYNNTVGFGVLVDTTATKIGSWDGQTCYLEPEGPGVSIVGKYYDIDVTKTATGMTVTDGTNTNTVTGTPRAMYSNLYLFAMYPYTGENLVSPVCGRIYYLNIVEGDVEKLDYVPCVRDSDSAAGFWNTVSSTFVTSTGFVAGPAL